MNALLVIDMQNACFDLTERFDKTGTIKRINELIHLFRHRSEKIIFIQHDGSAENYLFPNTPAWQLVDGLQAEAADIYISKTANDAFYRTDLLDVLSTHRIDTLYCTGLATDFCVNATVQSALTHDFHVIVAKDCHTTADRPMIKAEKLIEFFNWLWADLTPTRGEIKVKSLHDIKQELEN